MSTIAFQPEFRPALPVVFGCKEYREYRTTLEQMDRILVASGCEQRFLAHQIDLFEKRLKKKGSSLSARQNQRHCKTLHRALRYGILLGITGDSFRELSLRVSDSPISQWFTHTSFVDGGRPVSKSSIERFEKMFATKDLSEFIHALGRAVADPMGAEQLLYRETALRFDKIFADSTCVKANVHFPVDWILLRDSTRTLTKAIELIREHGLMHRIRPPHYFLREMNKLCIEMTHARRKTDSKKKRKQILRRMKKLAKTTQMHAQNYHRLLKEHWQETDWSEAETQIVLNRIKNILDQLPDAIQQAHDRIIGERRIANSGKILSLYDPDLHVLVRGKADAETEFGNGLYLAEQADGLIVDWKFIKGQPPSDSKLVKGSIKRISKSYGKPESYTGDRGFDSPVNELDLEELGIINAICPRSVPKLKEKLEDEGFCLLQKRRGSTEARIGIFKNAYLGKPLRSKGYPNRKTRIEWCILGHNLWKLAVLAAQKLAELEAELAEAA